MPDEPVSRGKFLRSLGSSMTGMALGTGIGVAAQALASRLASAIPETAAPAAKGEAPALVADPFIYEGDPEGNQIALTFDDGPTPGVTERILDELKKRGLVATFFMIGQRVETSPDLARRVASEGHEIGNHTFTHPKLSSLPDQQSGLEIDQTQDVIAQTIGLRPVCFRPPYLAFRRNQAPLAHDRGLKIICGNVDSRDWSEPGEDKICDTISSQSKAGSIIICHDLKMQTANCTGEFLDKLLERGFNFVGISSLVEFRK